MSTATSSQPAIDESLLASGLLHQLFEKQARLSPNAIAVVGGSQHLSYAELEARANQLANYLIHHGIRPGDRVGLLIPRSLQLYVALLGILKSGAAYVPLDPDYPSDRIAFILGDCGAHALVTVQQLAGKVEMFSAALICLDVITSELAWQPDAKPQLQVPQAANSLCYIIYTSGTTGRPKGVQIEHRSVCHLVRAEGKIFQVRPADRVYQGFSIAFDASVEEIWLAFFAGATLVAPPPQMAHVGPELAGWLSRAGVTVLSCVPTMLSMVEQDVPSVRLLILGGEACPPDLVKRWSKVGRRIVNTYGPTEATVIATYAELQPGQPVTIGKPLPNYTVIILDEYLQPAADGIAGELCIGGIGLASGYIGRPELTEQKFIHWSSSEAPQQRLYRTGDLARRTSTGDFEFLGRLDSQVKIRGYRVELSEIEAVLLECPGVRAAAASLHQDIGGTVQLAAYVVSKTSVKPDLTRVRAHLRERLPAYMVPARLEVLPELPTLPSGKVDRKRLPVPTTESREGSPPFVSSRTPLESRVAQVWGHVLGMPAVSVADDLFLDLGGHSLIAARIVSELRKTPAFSGLSMADIYAYATIETLASQFEQRCSLVQPKLPVAESVKIPVWRHFWCGAAQAVSLIFILSFFALQWLAPYLTYTILIEEEYDFAAAVLGALASLVLLYPIMLAIPIVVKWLVIGRYREGSYPMWGWFYFRWWLVTRIEAAVPVGYLAGTPWLNVYLRLMGASIGRNVHLSSNNLAIYDLLSIGSESSINVDANLLGYTIEDGYLKLGRVSIGSRCFVGTRATASLNSAMDDQSSLEDLSLLSRGARIPSGESWQGSPAQKINPNQAYTAGESDEHRRISSRKIFFGLLQGLGLLLFPVLVVAALFPGIVVMNKLNYLDPYYWYLLLSPLVGLSFVVLLCLEIAALKWLLLGKIKPGRYPTLSFRYVRKWFVDQTLDLSLDILGPLYASVYLTPWYKLLGAKLGAGAEISTASFISPDLLSIGEESFIADNVSLGAARVQNGIITVDKNHIGKRTFIGNSALLPPATVIGDNALLGCLSTPPLDPAAALREEAIWLGSPAICLPSRQRTTNFGEQQTFAPSITLRVQRATIEFVRVIAPSTCFIILLSLLFSSLLVLHDWYSLGRTLFFFPVLYFGCAVAAGLFTVLTKWLLVWRYRPQEKPLWSTFVWRNELLNALHEHLAEPFLVGPLTGTPFICWYFRALGARIGRRVYMETTDLTEFDLVEVGDDAALNADCTIQTHLFEDRVMKMSHVRIGPRCTVGTGSLVLYDTQMQPGSCLGDLSLLMKNEILPGDTRWEGIPARPVAAVN
ncbi:MAG TPA: Pls/PosA family non-ribosomal peptide synthetase [Candidatus Limnocylindrales bacterium]|nr:Pls/PosA family non-ribosomal peptide synthetase [Candidatus Limnocylindrales bacterium]